MIRLYFRQKIALQHQLIPKYMANWKIEKAMEAAEIKVQLMKSIESQMMTTLPSAILEMYEMCRLGLVSYRTFYSFRQKHPLGFEHFGWRWMWGSSKTGKGTLRKVRRQICSCFSTESGTNWRRVYRSSFGQKKN